MKTNKCKIQAKYIWKSYLLDIGKEKAPHCCVASVRLLFELKSRNGNVYGVGFGNRLPPIKSTPPFILSASMA